MPKLSVDQALLLVEKRRHVWCLVGYDQYKRPRYACGTCFMFHFTRVSKKPAPPRCPRCGAEMGFQE